MADLLIRCEGIRQVLCGAVIDQDLFVSVRTKRDGDDAAQLVQVALQDLGRGGGHQHRAGGKIVGLAHSSKIVDQLHTQWLAACNVNQTRGIRLIAKRDVAANL